ncbi:urate hydroxylase PuuD [Pelagibius sp. Alg239-R121]|uniref:urate hydroxylase PuuD n=1 Tax=Pelagibius sp. Alg239-R121 TaxID=2993448 RepID=UPI0024A7623D|nr:urate hydroxylase PuuD [Pelagibius sp. Alg239-R121]
MDPLYWEWLNFGVRWLHVVTAIAWIGSSFYFIALDLGLRKREGLPPGVTGEEWQVHGGGFYYIQKYMIAPEAMPEHLIWFKWESYSTWLTGFFMMVVVYYAGAELYLIDRSVLDVPAWGAILISLAGLALGWGIYDLLCRSPLGKNDWLLYGALFAFVILLSWGFTQVFTGRAAFLHTGAVIATIMSANVFLIIIPNQKKVVTALRAGETPEARLGLQAKQRSTHNNYLTLPVIFLMLSNHYPLAFGTKWNWIIVSLVLVMGAIIRHFFNSMHAKKGKPWWTWGAAAVCFAAIVWLSTFPGETSAEYDISESQNPLYVSASFEEVRDTVLGRCSMCHAQEPYWDGIGVAPKGVILETDEQILRHAHEIYLQTGRSNAMPPGNITEISGEERRLIATWFEEASAIKR